ncbi:MAG: bifunctional indole-3-glycerol-phosphate synthase TrpC/phosphoribosylanthranilate isomerase TrpF [Pantoea sp. Brub]|nr:bifunctional indole-3-glycerol-phosphate synthase TrpC/phosphoribosylanthranilate isomerase TrpF [Pantoea sp. Brub]
MQDTVLNKIIKDKIDWISTRKKMQPLISFEKKIQLSNRDFYKSLKGKDTKFILECKKASPSKGLISKNFNLLQIANIYRKYASVISVLTDEKYFQGDFYFLSIISSVVKQPILCKDFIIDSYQIYLARHYCADAILLMLSVLDDKKYLELSALAKKLQMGILTEVSNEEEIKRAISLKAQVIGINNRNFEDLSVDLNHTKKLTSYLLKDEIVISESGISKYSDIRMLNHLVNGFLIGSALMKENDLHLATKKILFGNNKICGITRSQDAHIAYEAGAIFGGLIFIDKSPRKVNIIQARKIMIGVKLKYVGIYQNAKINEIIDTAVKLKLSAVQLHGDENQLFINELRKKLPSKIKIWKALQITNKIPKRNYLNIDLYVYDYKCGGSGQSFDWNLLKNEQSLSNAIIAGGLNINNCALAAKLGFSGLDLNSGIEINPGIKDDNKIKTIFHILRNC